MPDSEYEAREQSAIKHFALRQYLAAASRILGATKEIRFVDCCAGPWQSRTANFLDTSFGIALEELANSSEHLSKRGIQLRARSLLIERRGLAFAKLDAFASEQRNQGIRVEARNWDFSKRVPDIVKFASRHGAFPFIFIDPKGWKLAGIPTIENLLKVNPGEVLINFMSSFVTRFVKTGGAGLDHLLGGDISHLKSLSGDDLEAELIQHYCNQIKKVGAYSYVCALPILKPRIEAIHFYLVYATRHPKGVEVFKEVEKRTETFTRQMRSEVQQQSRLDRSGNFELFSPIENYREDRYLKLVNDNKARAKSALAKLLLSRRVSYKDCWDTALQFATVQEHDLREWLKGLESKGGIRIEGRVRAGEVLKRSSPHVIVRLAGDIGASDF